MARPLVSDELWELVEPLIPKVPRRHPSRSVCSLICLKQLQAAQPVPS
jgi:transposase